jgi:hypothetical protein
MNRTGPAPDADGRSTTGCAAEALSPITCSSNCSPSVGPSKPTEESASTSNPTYQNQYLKCSHQDFWKLRKTDSMKLTVDCSSAFIRKYSIHFHKNKDERI